jgi:SAM-dependent methyltransferase
MSGNLEHWEELAGFHGTGQDSYYDIDALVRGDMSLREPESAGLAIATRGRDLAGLRVAHVQSHIGIDSIHLARQGAKVTAFDFSPTALLRLRELAARCDVHVRTVVADSTELGSSDFAAEHGQYDIVYATVGVISWIDDLEAWMNGASALLRPGGRLMLLELHPLLCMLESTDPLVVDFPYVNDGRRHYEGTGSYANPDADLTWSVDQYAWSIGETVNAAIGAGLRVARLDEHVAAPFDPRGDVLRREDDGLFRLRLGVGAGGAGPEALPVLFTLIAEKPLPLAADEPAG